MIAPPPAWLTNLIELIMEHLDVHSPGAFGYRYGQEEDDEVWEIMLYPTPVELQGGSADGEWVFPGFSLDLKPLYEAFDTVDVLYWTSQSFGPHDQDNPSIAFEGRFQGHSVYLSILAYAPDDELPGMTLALPPPEDGVVH
jgi:hypothetical protein